jgi:Kef-type K+ transport system membrane component KefB
MREVQHLINIMIIVGILAAIAGFCYAGFLYIVHGSEPSSRSEASSVFKKVFIGFIIMLTAWFIVYQILSWLQCGANSTDCRSVGTALLGN